MLFRSLKDGGIGAAIASFILTKLNNFSMAFNISSLGIFFTLIYVIIRVNKVKPMKDKDNKKESIKEILYEIRRRKFVYKIINNYVNPTIYIG